LGRLGQNQAGQQYDATSGLLGNIGTLNDQYAAGRQAAAQQLAGGAMTAESNRSSFGTHGYDHPERDGELGSR